MIQKKAVFPQRLFSLADLVVVLLVAASIYGIMEVAREWRNEFSPVTYIELSAWALPRYALLSAARGLVAYLISLVFTLVVGYWAAHSKRAERFIIPLLDIGQGVPALGFLPGVLLGLMAIFPRNQIGLELAAVLIIFTSQVWNMTFSFHSSIKAIPDDLKDAATVMGLGRWRKLFRLELPFAAVDLTWNSVLSMAGGWFFLSVAEAFTLGDRQYRLPGIGSYMAVAIGDGNRQAIFLGILAMVLLILVMDFVLWRPMMAWVSRFRVEALGVSPEEGIPTEPLMRIWMRDSAILRWIKLTLRSARKKQKRTSNRQRSARRLPIALERLAAALSSWQMPRVLWVLELVSGGALAFLVVWGAYRLLALMGSMEWAVWVVLIRNTFWTLLRVLLAVILSTLWTVPVGIWIGISPRRLRIAQPIVQVLASFPAPMLYPLVAGGLFALGLSFDWVSMFLMMLGAQWYVLFNMLAGAARIPGELRYSLDLIQASRLTYWRRLFIPSVFPTLVAGWVIAAGGAWNASIVAEYMFFGGRLYRTGGLGATITAAAEKGDFQVLAASLALMVGVILLFNRLVWLRLYDFAQSRFKMDL